MLHTLTITIVLMTLSSIALPYSDSAPLPQPARTDSFVTRHWLLPGQSAAMNTMEGTQIRYYRV